MVNLRAVIPICYRQERDLLEGLFLISAAVRVSRTATKLIEVFFAVLLRTLDCGAVSAAALFLFMLISLRGLCPWSVSHRPLLR
ncbi:hypothetical protein SAMN04489724_0851 [Algoriphagus locisalis]|uniref:Uncharacterized protein n=1 Tax=Algoriphagus locisalis TaxID=305507 RepID=A0A1I6Y6R9_9BACT|nr:hypothetical protein SAMN04489724_0851 [Algoriphagus locisalis]